MVKPLARREEVAVEDTWDIESIYADVPAWEEGMKRVEALLPQLSEYAGKLNTSAETLVEFLQLRNRADAEMRKVYVFAQLRFDADTSNQANAALLGRMQGLYSRYSAALAFAQPELLAMGYERLSQFTFQQAALKMYRHAFEDLLRQAAHVRSGEVETLLAQAFQPLVAVDNTYGVLTDADLKFPAAKAKGRKPVEVAQGTVDALLSSPDRETRRAAWEAYADGHLAMKNTFAELLAGKVKRTVFLAKARNHPDALSYALSPSNIPAAVYHNVIDACNRNIHVWHRYWDIRRRALKLDQMETFDIFAPLSKPPTVKYKQAAKWIIEGLQPLGKKYANTVRDGLLKERWVDVYPNVGKRSGAYSAGTWGTKPFILMSYSDSGLGSLSTLAHEIGHSMHSHLANQAQPVFYSDYSLFIAEVASNFDQALVRAHLLTLDRGPEFEMAVIQEAMDNFHRYFFIMPILAQFELHIHQTVEQGGALTADGMNEHLAGLFKRGYGDAVKVDDAREGITWAQFSHLYADFYVYQYASGIAAANALADAVLKGETNAAERYLASLRAGGSMYPIDALQMAGIDMTKPEPMDRAFKVLEGFVDRLEKLVK